MYFWKRMGASLLAGMLVHVPGYAQPSPKVKPAPYPFEILLPKHFGEITQTYFPPQRIRHSKPDFILIQNIHSNIIVQFAISNILAQLKTQGMLPQRIAVEGGVGLINIQGIQRNLDTKQRRSMANTMVSKGEMTGATHFIAATGVGQLYGVEDAEFYQSAIDMFRRSYYSRIQLRQELDRLEAAINLIKMEPGEASRASILEQDIQVIRHLVDQQLVPTEIHQVMNRAVFAVEHLKTLVSGKKERTLLEPVSAAVNFYAFALLRDRGLFEHSLELRRQEGQRTTVLIAGGFHTAGITRQLKEEGYSYAVITPVVGAYNESDERLYVGRLLGYPITTGRTVKSDAPLLTFPLDTAKDSRKNASETWILASHLRSKLARTPFSIPSVRDIFTAMDHPLQPAIKVSLVKQRAEMLASAQQIALNH